MAQLEAENKTNSELPWGPEPISLTQKAAEMVVQAMEQEDLQGVGLRVGVVGGGCSGLQYNLDFSESPTPEDFELSQHGVRIFIDPYSAAHLRGTVIDYHDGLQGSGFKFENPNVQRTCGCGSSFQ